MDATRPRLAAEPLPTPIAWPYRIEAWGAALLFALLGCMPLDAASAVGGMLARRIGPRHGVSNRARRNLRAALPGLSAAQIAAILRGMCDALGRVAAEYPQRRNIRLVDAMARVP